MSPRLLCLLALIVVGSACQGARPPLRFADLRVDPRPAAFHHDIRLYTLDNGMTVALLPDRRTNLVTVDARYSVGASDDPSGRAGLAHLVEHLSFEFQVDAEHERLSDRLGDAALQYNAYTNHDVTHYTATALAGRLATLIDVEARRLEATCAQLDEEVFLRERAVVLAEAAERRSAWDQVLLALGPTVWGERHPYARGLGTHELTEASREEACRFLNAHYAPDRLTLVITGDFAPEPVAQALGKRFGRITRRSTTPPATVTEARLLGTRSQHLADVEDPAAWIFLPAPAWGGEEEVMHELSVQRLRQVLSEANDEREWLTGVSVSTQGEGRARLLLIRVSVDSSEHLEDAVNEVFTRASTMFVDVHPYLTANLLGRLQTAYMTSYESFLTRGAWLADYLTYTRHEGFMVPQLQALGETSLADADVYVRVTFQRARSHIAFVNPQSQTVASVQTPPAAGREFDLAPWRTPVDPQDAHRALPAPTPRSASSLEEWTLDNGLRVLLAPDPTSQLVDARLVLPQGWASDPLDRRGRAEAASLLLEPNPARLYGKQEQFLLGWGLSLGTQLDENVYETSTVFTARGVASAADWHVWRLLWRVEQCGYLPDSVRLFRDGLRHTSASRDAQPAQDRVRQLLFGAHHPYAAPTTADDLNWLSAAELERYHQAHYVPRGATLIVTGGFDPEAMRRHVRALFTRWADSASSPPGVIASIQPEPGPHWVGVRDSSRAQVGLRVAFATASDANGQQAARRVLREMVNDRLRSIREGMGASYGVQVAYAPLAGGGTFDVEGELEPARAAKAAVAIVSELERLRTGAGALEEDFVRARRRVLATTLADMSGATALAEELEYDARRGLPLDYFARLSLALSQLTPEQVAAVAAVDLAPSRRVVLVTAPPEHLEPVLQALGATQPQRFDSARDTRSATAPAP